MKKAALIMLLISALLLASCGAAIPDSQVDYQSIEQRLNSVDAYKETIPDRAEALSFRGVSFGSTIADVTAAETQPLAASYSNALDYEPVEVYSYSMQPTYWFDNDSLLYSGSYNMVQSDFAAITQDLKAQLTEEFGKPTDANYYDYNNTVVTYASDDEALAAVDGSSAYYYVSFEGQSKLRVELFVQASSSGGYEYYIYYTDPDYITED